MERRRKAHGLESPARIAAGLITAAGLLLALAAAPMAGAATITPDIVGDDFSDNDDCSLREAIDFANNDGNAPTEDSCAVSGEPLGTNDTIQLGAGDYMLTLGVANNPLVGSGDLDIYDDDDLRIKGAGAGSTTITQTVTAARVFHALGGRLTVEDLTVTGGETNATRSGAGIAVGEEGSLDVISSVITQNTSEEAGAGLAIEPAPPVVPANVVVNITDSRITENDALTTADQATVGGGLYARPSAANVTLTLNITDSDIHMNEAERGGGIATGPETTLNLTRSTVRGNRAIDAATSTSGPEVAGGGGLNLTGPALITDSVISHNSAETAVDSRPATGGGLRTTSSADVVVRRSAIVDNTVDLSAATGESGSGGGVANVAGSVTLINTTVSGNTVPDVDTNATTQGGGIYSSGTTKVISSTLAANTAGGGANDLGDALHRHNAGTIDLENSIITGPNPARLCSGTSSSSGHNVINATPPLCINAAEPGDAVTTDPLLEPLGDNGNEPVGHVGFELVPRTHLLPEGSPAVDLVPAAECDDHLAAPLTLDGRNEPRPFGGACDAGAFERGAPENPPVVRCLGQVATVVGTGGADNLTGTPGRDVVVAFGGNDVISTGLGNDLVCAGGGNDRVFTRAGFDRVLGQGGHDRIFGGAGRDFLFGHAGFDRIFGGAGFDRIFGGARLDRMFGGPGNDRIFGGPGHDRAFGNAGRDLLVGAAGRDRLFGGAGRDTLRGLGGRPDRCFGGGGADNPASPGCEIRSSIP